jgi:hypothetical protein
LTSRRSALPHFANNRESVTNLPHYSYLNVHY